jgi:hypothetical protein
MPAPKKYPDELRERASSDEQRIAALEREFVSCGGRTRS